MTTAVVYLFLLVFALALVVATAKFAALLPTYKEELAASIDDVTSWLKRLGGNQAELDAISSSFDVGKLAEFVSNMLNGLVGVWAWVLGAVGALLAIPLSLFVNALLVDSDPSSRWLSPLIGDTTQPASEAPAEAAP